MPSSSFHRSGRRARPRNNPAQRAHPSLHRPPLDPESYRRRSLLPDEVRWARELWEHREPLSEIADQLDVEVARIETLIARWREEQE